ncbi:MAG: NAD(P)-binding domain-containing protein [Acidimicrobiales bacterium]|nr:NAD(P)-binding domain-containing protein [Acidimicrobiales bacterium]
MNTTTVTIIGAGQAGLAMSRTLTDRSIDHVIVERGTVANSWSKERWDSLRLLTPNWMTRLPGYSYTGADPEGYMTAAEVVYFLNSYWRTFDAPIHEHTSVDRVTHTDDGHMVDTSNGPISTKAVVVATGACSNPRIPSLASALPSHIRQIAPIHYRNPAGIGDGRVLVVGASASGAQIADELRRAGKDVTLAVGDHVRLPRTYRGMDIHWWMDAIGLLDERYTEMEDIGRARRLPSLQLVGSPERRTLDLGTLRAAGVQLVGRFVGVAGGNAQFSGSFANQCKSADLKLERLLQAIDQFAADHGLDPELPAPDRPAPTAVPPAATTAPLSGFGTVVWATGFRPSYPWLDTALLDRKGAINHDGGVMARPGMYVLGLPFTRRRKSSFIDGVGPDAQDLAAHLGAYLDSQASPAYVS